MPEWKRSPRLLQLIWNQSDLYKLPSFLRNQLSDLKPSSVAWYHQDINQLRFNYLYSGFHSRIIWSVELRNQPGLTNWKLSTSGKPLWQIQHKIFKISNHYIGRKITEPFRVPVIPTNTFFAYKSKERYTRLHQFHDSYKLKITKLTLFIQLKVVLILLMVSIADEIPDSNAIFQIPHHAKLSYRVCGRLQAVWAVTIRSCAAVLWADACLPIYLIDRGDRSLTNLYN